MHSSLKIFFRYLWTGLPQNPEQKTITIPKTDAFQKMGDKFPNIKVNTSLRLISMDTVTAQKKLNFSARLGTTLCAQFPLIMSRDP